MSKKRILITGGAGFIGSHTADYLLKQGHQLVILDNLSSGKIDNLDLSQPGIELIEGDVLELPLLESLVNDTDAVLHLAAIASVPYSLEHPIYSFQVNTQGALHVFEAVRKTGRDIRIVYASSAAVYGDASELPCRDDQPLMGLPQSPYALQKLQVEQYADLYERVFGIKSLGLRYFNVYGPRQDPSSPYSGVISRYLDATGAKESIRVFGDGEQSRDFIHVSDIARANQLALESDFHGVLNVATGQAQTLMQLIGHIKQARQGETLKVEMLPARSGDIRHSYAAVEQASQQIGFSSSVSLAQGIEQLINQS